MGQLRTYYPKNSEELSKLVKDGTPLIMKGAGTSTVLPFSNLSLDNAALVSLDNFAKDLYLNQNGRLVVKGPATWQEAREFLRPMNLDLPLWPTDTTAHMIAGVATAASGERCFHYGPLRKHVMRITVMNSSGKLLDYTSERPFNGPSLNLKSSGDLNFKNNLIPYIETEIDPFLGSEGQLGIVTELEITPVPLYQTETFFVLIDPWDSGKDIIHSQIFKWSGKNREKILSCEFLDHHALKFISSERFSQKNLDMIFWEVPALQLSDLIENLVHEIPEIKSEHIGQIPSFELTQMRLEVPRKLSDYIANNKLTKKGTDLQIAENHFENLVRAYQKLSQYLSKEKIHYLLFGHFGDGHLHFNALPSPDLGPLVDTCYEKFYDQMIKFPCMPFAEHGIGLLKQKFWFKYVPKEAQLKLKELKQYFDPQNIFNPLGHLSNIK